MVKKLSLLKYFWNNFIFWIFLTKINFLNFFFFEFFWEINFIFQNNPILLLAQHSNILLFNTHNQLFELFNNSLLVPNLAFSNLYFFFSPKNLPLNHFLIFLNKFQLFLSFWKIVFLSKIFFFFLEILNVMNFLNLLSFEQPIIDMMLYTKTLLKILDFFIDNFFIVLNKILKLVFNFRFWHKIYKF